MTKLSGLEFIVLCLFLSVMFIAGVALTIRVSKEHERPNKSFAQAMFVLVSMLRFQVGFIWLAPRINGLLDSINLHAIHFFAGTMVLLVGALAALFKAVSKTWYGVVEILVAWITATTITMRLTSANHDLSTWTALAGPAYVVSRGIENAITGWLGTLPSTEPLIEPNIACESANAGDTSSIPSTPANKPMTPIAPPTST